MIINKGLISCRKEQIMKTKNTAKHVNISFPHIVLEIEQS